ERPAVALELLQDQPLAAEQAGSEAPRQGDGDADTLGAGEIGAALAVERPAFGGEVEGADLPRHRRGEAYRPPLAAGVGEERHEEGLARDLAQDRAEETAGHLRRHR